MLSLIREQPLYYGSLGLLTLASLKVIGAQFNLSQRFFNQLWYDESLNNNNNN
ncbi:hypothetical protein PPL_06067 [Heterostelium album PN500]|uniref:Uncharacterized protein n=1 Tax=Heterostelium pallidum (strain ATCC 26659 / Pp 5 / PN500) TaxID=670386 RepID=D3BC45_HETP5|nr:hypothetical protein PPL_06067 [Heterostelium album PN500]EFA81228.1 hypothetical protein PPL_06067 [Heterostelium album PN500]|eukprot:XP_020433346.1 hypothetical protein PPL_06067 [Heterostelium album PN500]